MGGKDYKKPFIESARKDEAASVQQTALMAITDLFRGQRDREILTLGYEIYQQENNNTSLRLAAAATLMYQLGISHDQDGRPAWWNDEDMDHPAIQRAISETRDILNE